MLRYAKSAIGGVAVATMIAAGSVIAAPPANAEPGVYGGEVIKVGGWKSGKYWNRNWNRGNWNNGNWNNGNWWVGPAIGFGAGVLLGSALSQPRYYYAPPPVRYYGDRDAYCHAKYRSYNSYTGTYTGYDGRQHYCRIP
ncbi:MAG TPA: BA14K family protein [Bauldia sp.]|nr:BA14K family protein [Bauldia sp.]